MAYNDCYQLFLQFINNQGVKEEEDVNVLMNRFFHNNNVPNLQLDFNAIKVASHLVTLRKDALQQFNNNNKTNNTIDIVQITTTTSKTKYKKKDGVKFLSREEFQKEYIYKNIPCLIRSIPEFQTVTQLWKSSSNPTSTINTDWFCQKVGKDTMVPIRYNTTNNNTNNDIGLDDEGRSMECQTKYISMLEWIQQQQQQQPPNGNDYLKDWHLQQFLEQQQQQQEEELYQVPSIFPNDLFHQFLRNYTIDKSDYRFVYWGPKTSRTELHSDVLHSFSWSYNVVGTKRWIFHVPNDNTTTTTNHTISVLQTAGDTMFVPSTWKHTVENMEETLSINHNWITANIMDQMWDCISVEQKAIQKELRAWNNLSLQDYTIQETMLQSCCGINTTSFVLLLLTNCYKLASLLRSSTTTTWETTFDLVCLYQVLKSIIVNHEDLQLQQRLEASCQSKQMANNILHLSTMIIRIIDTNIIRTTTTSN